MVPVSKGVKPDRVCARNVIACWAIRELDLTATEVGRSFGLSKLNVSRAATRGQQLVTDLSLSLED